MSAPRGSIVAKLLARMMFRSGLSHLITLDLHQKEIQGFFDCPVDNLRASPFLVSYIRESVRDKHKRAGVDKEKFHISFLLLFFFLTLCSPLTFSSFTTRSISLFFCRIRIKNIFLLVANLLKGEKINRSINNKPLPSFM